MQPKVTCKSKACCCRLYSRADQYGRMSDFQAWEDRTLWPSLKSLCGIKESAKDGLRTPNIAVDICTGKAQPLKPSAALAKVTVERTLTKGHAPQKKHIEIQLPPGMNYRAGDYCAVLPSNLRELVHDVMANFGLLEDAILKISSNTQTFLPTAHPISAYKLFPFYLELSQPATERDIAMLMDVTVDASTQAELKALLKGHSKEAVASGQASLFTLLRRFPRIELPLATFINSLMIMRMRQYSISSSPLHGNSATLTYSVLREPLEGGKEERLGVASNYLASLKSGDVIQVEVRPSHRSFYLPSESEITPVIMIAAGAGIAPFRGFNQERAIQLKSGEKLAPAMLFFGCRHPGKDDLYREEIDQWEASGAVTTRRTYSQLPDKSGGYKHVDEAIYADREILHQMWQQDAKVYVCGSRRFGQSVKRTLLTIAKERATKDGQDAGDDAVGEWFEHIKGERYVTDVFD